MSSYHSSFKYLNKKSDEDFGWIISHFDPDNGETDSYLSQDQVYSDSYDGTKRNLYGTKWNSVANVKITVIKHDGSDFTLGECREAYKWLTGNPEASWMDLYIGDEVKYRLLCTIQNVKPHKIDARTVGLNIYCESLSPWAYSPIQTVSKSFTSAGSITINNESDDMYSFIYPKVVYENTDGTSLFMSNTTTKEATTIEKLDVNEVITLHPNQFITSDNPNKTFGNTFNFVWPRLKSGVNNFNINAKGKLTFEYYYPIKMGDCAQNINIVRDPICDDFNNIQVDTLPWERVSGTPNTLSGYGITDAYTKTEADANIASKTEQFVKNTRKIANIDLTDDITVEELQEGLDVYPLIIDSDPPTKSTKGYEKQIYFDIENSTFYVCRGLTSGGDYLWDKVTTDVGDIGLSGYSREALFSRLIMINSFPPEKKSYLGDLRLVGLAHADRDPYMLVGLQNGGEPTWRKIILDKDIVNFVSNTLKIAGLELKGDITAKELQEGLDVYPVILGENHPVNNTTRGRVGQFYYDVKKSKLYICYATAGGSYTYWQQINTSPTTDINEEELNLMLNEVLGE